MMQSLTTCLRVHTCDFTLVLGRPHLAWPMSLVCSCFSLTLLRNEGSFQKEQQLFIVFCWYKIELGNPKIMQRYIPYTYLLYLSGQEKLTEHNLLLANRIYKESPWISQASNSLKLIAGGEARELYCLEVCGQCFDGVA